MKETNLNKPISVDDLKPGDVLLFPPMSDGLIGQAIICLTGGVVSHAAIYLGEIENEKTVAHAILDGIETSSLPSLLDSEPGCYVNRFTGTEALEPVVDIAKSYVLGENPYPKANLGVLGILLLMNSFSEKILINRKFYDFALLVGLKIMKTLQETIHPGKTPMSCSQFAAQCYTDATGNYDIQFKELIIQYGNLKAIEGETSLFELSAMQTLNSLSIDNQDAILNDEHQIVANFLKLLQNKDVICESVESVDAVSKEKLAAVAKILLQGLSKSKLDDIKFSTNRNYYVTPDDLLSNAINLEHVGFIAGNEK